MDKVSITALMDYTSPTYYRSYIFETDNTTYRAQMDNTINTYTLSISTSIVHSPTFSITRKEALPGREHYLGGILPHASLTLASPLPTHHLLGQRYAELGVSE
jgi:hypothetical protein